MASVTDVLSSSKPPLGAALADGVRTLSGDQTIEFSLYRAYVFPLDGMRYWLKLPSSTTSITTPGLQLTPGLASHTRVDGEAIQIVAGGLGALDVIGGTIVNPLSAADQGLDTAEPLYVDFTGPPYLQEQLTTVELLPGDSIKFPAAPTYGIWANAVTGGHKFTVVVEHVVAAVTLPTSFEVQGSFHYDSAIEQREDAVVDSNTVVFSALEEVQAFNDIGPDFLYIAHYRNLTFAFASRGRLYEQADLYHYLGKALYSVSATQIIDDPDNFNPTLVVSNSLPIWLHMPNYTPPYPGFTCPLPLFPSFLVTDNLPPPFGSVHIETTDVLNVPILGPRWQEASLNRDVVRVTLYGASARMAADFVAFVLQYSTDTMRIGIGIIPNITDEKHPQSEMQILAQRKRVDFNVSYANLVARDQARQFIEHAKVNFIPAWLQT